jgi:hyperosmotically inducible periplasmic protein
MTFLPHSCPKTIFKLLLAILFAGATLGSANLHAQSAPDNSRHNKSQTETADSQSNSTSDRQLTAKIRKAITSDKDLSTYAHNIKIITVSGAVTLKGPVKSEEEKQKIATDVANVVSSDKITNELTVKQ